MIQSTILPGFTKSGMRARMSVSKSFGATTRVPVAFFSHFTNAASPEASTVATGNSRP
jgi:hypothetical protein